MSPVIRLSASSTIMDFVVSAKPLDPVRDVSGLSAFVVRAMSIEDPPAASWSRFVCSKNSFSSSIQISGIGGVAEDEEIEMANLPRQFDQLEDSFHAREQPMRASRYTSEPARHSGVAISGSGPSGWIVSAAEVSKYIQRRSQRP